MALDRSIADQLFIVEEHGHDDDHVLGMRAGPEGPVVDQRISRIEGFGSPIGLDRLVDAEGQRAHEHRKRRRLGEQPDFLVVDRHREVEHLVNDG